MRAYFVRTRVSVWTGIRLQVTCRHPNAAARSSTTMHARRVCSPSARASNSGPPSTATRSMCRPTRRANWSDAGNVYTKRSLENLMFGEREADT